MTKIEKRLRKKDNAVEPYSFMFPLFMKKYFDELVDHLKRYNNEFYLYLPGDDYYYHYSLKKNRLYKIKIKYKKPKWSTFEIEIDKEGKFKI